MLHKEIKEVLSKQEKSAKLAHQAKLFEPGGDDGPDHASAHTRDRDTSADDRHSKATASAFDVPQRDTNNRSTGS